MGAGKPTPSIAPLYRFGPFEVDIARRELRKFGAHIRLERKPWQVLVLLLERRGEILTRAELQQRLWGENVFVDFENGLNVAVKKLRSALGDSAESPRYVKTIAGEGYCFVAPVEMEPVASEANAPASLPIAGADTEATVGLFHAETGAVAKQDVADQAPPSWMERHKRAFVIAVVLLLSLSIAAPPTWRRLWPATPVYSEKVMIVVLPFENLTGNRDQDYLSDGITEELSSQLGNLEPQHLAVIGRTSAMAYKNSHATIRHIGKELGVDFVLEGSVRRDGENVRVTAQLVRVSNQARVWAEDYEGNLRDLLGLEGNIAGDIAREVGVSITLAQANSATTHVPTLEAHQAYLLGRYNWNKRMPAGWRAAEQYFRQAIQADPQYGAAYAGLAECRIETREAEAAALKAVELDPASGDARTALGWVELYRDWDFRAAERAFQTAVQLDPNYAPAHHSYSEYLAFVGNMQASLAEKKTAVLLDPLSPIFRAALAELLSVTGHDDLALQEVQRVFEIQPDYPKGHEVLAGIYLRQGKYKDAIREYQTSEQHGGDDETSGIAIAYARAGDLKKAQKLLERLQTDGDTADEAAVDIALGRKNEALTLLEKAYQEHEGDSLLGLKTDPIYDPLRSEPRFEALLRRMNFPR